MSAQPDDNSGAGPRMPADPFAPPGAGTAFAPSPHGPAGGEPTRGGWRDDTTAFLSLLLGSIVLGALAGALWSVLAPAVRYFVLHDPTNHNLGQGFPVAPESKTYIGQDGWFGLIGACAGLVAAVIAFWLFRRRGLGATLGLVLGGVAGSLLAWWVGTMLGPSTHIASILASRPDGAQYDHPLDLRARGVLMIWPLVAAVVWLFLTSFWGPSDEVPIEERDYPTLPSWDQRAS